ncbi:MAG: hypothetical protein QM811_28340 [Pirellulales bacterium]
MTDGDLDAALRQPTPRGRLRDRLLAIGTRSDTDLDDELRSVDVSSAWMERCLAIPAETVPAERRGAFETLRRSPAWRFALAASLLLIVSVVGWRMSQDAVPTTVPPPHRELRAKRSICSSNLRISIRCRRIPEPTPNRTRWSKISKCRF